MGRLLGSHDADENYDRPDLNKCPDCQTYFASENCPICGKPCPDNMKAGARPAVKRKKQKKGNATRRVLYIDWYHNPWFILLMAFLFPIGAVILLITSPHEKKWKYIFVPVLVLWILSRYGLGGFLLNIISREPPPIDPDTPVEEIMEKCSEKTPEEIFRNSEVLKEQYVKVTLTVERTVYDYGTNTKYNRYLVCLSRDSGSYRILINDLQDTKFIKGDIITVYGMVIEDKDVYSDDGTVYSGACIASNYIELVKEKTTLKAYAFGVVFSNKI